MSDAARGAHRAAGCSAVSTGSDCVAPRMKKGERKFGVVVVPGRCKGERMGKVIVLQRTRRF